MYFEISVVLDNRSRDVKENRKFVQNKFFGLGGYMYFEISVFVISRENRKFVQIIFFGIRGYMYFEISVV